LRAHERVPTDTLDLGEMLVGLEFSSSRVLEFRVEVAADTLAWDTEIAWKSFSE